jgi:hypothetical protein
MVAKTGGFGKRNTRRSQALTARLTHEQREARTGCRG